MNGPTKNPRQTLTTERSFDSSTGRPTKYFKLDRTYSDVVEDELYDPEATKLEDNSATHSSPKTSTTAKTQRIEAAYPQLFDRASISRSHSSETKFGSRDQYWPGMESGIRFEREQNEDGRRDPSIIADKKLKLNQQPEQSTVSPKEAFLDYPDGADLHPKNSVFDVNSSRENSSASTGPLLRHSSSSLGSRGIQFPQLSFSHNIGDIAAPKTITPVRAHEKSSPKPVTSSVAEVKSAGPSEAQAYNNTVANAKIRALYKEESTTSNTSATSDLFTPTSVAETDSEYHTSSSIHSRVDALKTERRHACKVCNEDFDRPGALDLHMRIHARPPANAQQQPLATTGDDADYGEDYEDDDTADEETKLANRARLKQGGPHRCDWIIPTTGEVCGTVFSRPYDLVRHQDTIHRAKKLEFKCEICISAGTNKVFSRNDALVRHVRHVHKTEP